jgi:hypothetical protein
MVKKYINTEDTKVKELVNKLEGVEQKYFDWFKKRPSILDQYPHDTIDNHVFIEQEGNGATLSFWKYSELPDSIKKDCLIAYKEVFSETAA